MSFKEINLQKELLDAVEALGYTSPTPIQEQAIPTILDGCDLRASAHTGTGKTAAFLLPALAKVAPKPPLGISGPRVLVLVPTRELAMQVTDEAKKLSRFLPKVKTVCIYGGVPFPQQKRQLSRKVDILVATPGRLIDHIKRSKLDLSSVELLVLDEADRMLDMGFIAPVKEIASNVAPSRQTLLFSATLKGEVIKLSKELLNQPKEISVAGKMTNHDSIEQKLHFADNLSHKNKLLNHILSADEHNQAIIFTSTKRFTTELVDILKDQGHQAAPLHGDMCQRQRTRTMKLMREGKIRVLVATDVAARGLDVNTISHVINFDLPPVAEDYVHRIGRTGRAGAKGSAISFVTAKDHKYLREIEQFTGEKIATLVIPGLEPKTKVTQPQNSKNRNNNHRRKHIKPGHKRKRFGAKAPRR